MTVEGTADIRTGYLLKAQPLRNPYTNLFDSILEHRKFQNKFFRVLHQRKVAKSNYNTYTLATRCIRITDAVPLGTTKITSLYQQEVYYKYGRRPYYSEYYQCR